MTKIGIIGCGNISGIYLRSNQVFPILDIVACADLLPERARAAAEEYGIQPLTVEDMLAHSDIEIIINLTIPAAHAEVSIASLSHDKSVYSEKPLALNTRDGRAILELAAKDRLRVGCAPDTFLGAGIQTCRKLIDDGWIGEPIAASAFMTNHGHESWHPDPEFYYQVGGGPMFDMGPYYLTALIALMGPVTRVTGSARATFPHRTITSQPKYGKTIKVEVPTHVVGVLDFAGGAVGTIVTTFDVWSAQLPRIEIYGTEGTLSVPDPNTFGGPVHLRRHADKEWSTIPLTHLYAENSRGLGVADMATAMNSGRPHRANGEMALHVLEIMESIHVASAENRHVRLQSTCLRPDPLPMGLLPGVLDD
jgi:predicted dehydrogenase